MITEEYLSRLRSLRASGVMPRLAAVAAVINIALGWTFVGWIVALVMAMYKAQPPVVLVFSQVNIPVGSPSVNNYWPPYLGSDPHGLPSAGVLPPPEE